MAVEDYFDNLFKTACGWLGWVPEVVLTSTISQIELALEGKIDFVKKTNPFGGKEDEEEKILNEPQSPEMAMKKLTAMVRRRQRNLDRKSKPRVK